MCSNNFSALWSTLYIAVLLCTSSFLTQAIRVTPTKFSNTSFQGYYFFLKSLLISQACVPYNTLLVQLPIIQKILHIYTQSSIAQHTFKLPPPLYKPHSSSVSCTFHILHPLPLDIKRFETFYFLICLPFCLMSSQSTYRYLGHLITLFLPTFTLKFLLLHTLANSLTSVQKFSTELATKWCIIC